jgi:general secretion pathway protein F
MPRFIYKAKVSPGRIKEGVIEADSQAQAALKLGNMGLFILSIEDETAAFIKKSKGRLLFFKSIPLRVLSNFTRQLSNLLDSGLAMLNAMGVLIDQTDNPYFRQVISIVRDDIKDGATFSSALSKHPKVFSNLYINMVSSGEISGSLEEVLKRLSDFMEKDEENMAKVRASMAYPVLMAVVGFITIFVLLTFVAPRLISIFIDLGQALPLPTKILIWISSFLARFWVLIMIGIIFCIFAFNRWSMTKDGRARLDKIKLKVFLLGAFIQKVEIARFSRTLATLIGNGVPVIQALSIAAATIENTNIKHDMESARKDVVGGAPLSAGIKKSKSFPFMVANMIAVGEESGTLERSLSKIADSYDTEIDRTIKTMTSLLEPGLILFMGLVVGFIVISMLLPIFQLNLMVR